MHDESLAASLTDGTNEIAHKIVALALVNADAVLHGDGHAHHIQHGLDTVSHQLRLGHQAGPESAALHPLAGATAVEVDLVIAPLLTQLGGQRQVSRLAAAQLQGQRMLFGIEAQMPRHIAVQERTGGDHLGVEQRVAREQAVKVTAMPVRPIHHRRYAEAARVFGDCCDQCHGLVWRGAVTAASFSPKCLSLFCHSFGLLPRMPSSAFIASCKRSNSLTRRSTSTMSLSGCFSKPSSCWRIRAYSACLAAFTASNPFQAKRGWGCSRLGVAVRVCAVSLGPVGRSVSGKSWHVFMAAFLSGLCPMPGTH